MEHVMNKHLKDTRETYYVIFYIIFKFIYLLWERDRESKQGRGRETERGTRESQPGSTLSALSPMRDSNSRTVRSWPEPKSRFGCLTDWATQACWDSILISRPKHTQDLLLGVLFFVFHSFLSWTKWWDGCNSLHLINTNRRCTN